MHSYWLLQQAVHIITIQHQKVIRKSNSKKHEVTFVQENTKLGLLTNVMQHIR